MTLITITILRWKSGTIKFTMWIKLTIEFVLNKEPEARALSADPAFEKLALDQSSWLVGLKRSVSMAEKIVFVKSDD